MRLSCLFMITLLLEAAPPVSKLTILPANPLLFGKDATQRLIVIANYADGSTAEVTAQAALVSERPGVALLQEGATVRAVSDGGAAIRARYQGISAVTTALVQKAGTVLPASFSGNILPILTKYGCSGGSCHGALNGKNGFKLSLFGYDPEADFQMITSAHEGRRLDRANAENSLLLRKPSFEVTHGGGKLLKKDSPDYAALAGWIRAGATRNPLEDRRITQLRVLPETNVLSGKDASRQLLVRARYSDGTEGDVTHLVQFSSNDDTIAAVSRAGVMKALRGGETAIVVRAPGLTAAVKVGVVAGNSAAARLEEYNFIDRHVGAKLNSLRIPASPLADDATFLRRAFLDIIGLIPAAEEARRFLADQAPDKRTKLVDALLRRPEYADYWAIYWGDHLSNTRQLLYNKGPYTFSRWLHDGFQKNMPYDQFARELLVSTGNMYDAPATSYYPLMRKELDLASMTSQLFMSVSIECARCHNHPLEKWTQDDFNGMAAVFSQVRYKSAGPRNNERILYLDFARQFQNPDTNQKYLAKALGGPYFKDGDFVDHREQLADWLTSKDNPFFARSIVNRMWHNFFGRGFVEPVDDFRTTNPPTNEPLLDELARDFAAHGFDLHHLIRRITASRTYQTSAVPVPGNKEDKMAYSRYYPKRLGAEPLMDSIALATGSLDEFVSLYPGTRAMQIPDPEIVSYFLDVFDRPSRQLICERKNTPTLNQALHLVSSDSIQPKLADPRGNLEKWSRSGLPPEKAVEEMYLATLSRFPDAEERKMAVDAVAKAGGARSGLEDVFWALLSSKEFLYNH
ncbi:MAG: DUF1553 domain-containing protein [Acidobacteriia bacterium]|nr:DUF1553 domain-containing protein [Terriglobia bacterium]